MSAQYLEVTGGSSKNAVSVSRGEAEKTAVENGLEESGDGKLDNLHSEIVGDV